jgi:hypothetical protein
VQTRRRRTMDWQTTVQLLQPINGSKQLIGKPTLKPELLQTVPFKFLHDVIVAVCLALQSWHAPHLDYWQRTPCHALVRNLVSFRF